MTIDMVFLVPGLGSVLLQQGSWSWWRIRCKDFWDQVGILQRVTWMTLHALSSSWLSLPLSPPLLIAEMDKFKICVLTCNIIMPKRHYVFWSVTFVHSLAFSVSLHCTLQFSSHLIYTVTNLVSSGWLSAIKNLKIILGMGEQNVEKCKRAVSPQWLLHPAKIAFLIQITNFSIVEMSKWHGPKITW